MKTKLNKINFPRSRSLLTNFRLSYKYAMATILNYRDALIGTSIIIGALCILILSEDYVASSYATGSKNKQPHSHLTHSRIGSHGMVLITDGIKLYASHLPLYHKPHDYQLLYQISTKHQSEIINQLQQHKTITILPDKFDLIIAGRQCKTGKTFSLPIFSSELLEKVDTAKLSTINQIAEINQAITFCRNTQVLYLETRDFK